MRYANRALVTARYLSIVFRLISLERTVRLEGHSIGVKDSKAAHPIP